MKVNRIVSRYGVGWLLGGAIMIVYRGLVRPNWPLWPFLAAAILLTMVGDHLVERYLIK